jgi:hypothetical protein
VTQPQDGNETSIGEERIPAMQRLLDNPFLLLILGVAIPGLLYVVWGVIEVTMIPDTPVDDGPAQIEISRAAPDTAINLANLERN